MAVEESTEESHEDKTDDDLSAPEIGDSVRVDSVPDLAQSSQVEVEAPRRSQRVRNPPKRFGEIEKAVPMRPSDEEIIWKYPLGTSSQHA